MAEQNYSNHRQYYIAHHFVFYPVILILIAFCIREGMKHEDQQSLWIALAVITALIGWLSFMLRQHYSLILQNRIILSELRYRYFVITGHRFEEFESRLSRSQLFALRFAGDNELASLTERAVREKLSADKIKKAVTHWRADKQRV